MSSLDLSFHRQVLKHLGIVWLELRKYIPSVLKPVKNLLVLYLVLFLLARDSEKFERDI